MKSEQRKAAASNTGFAALSQRTVDEARARDPDAQPPPPRNALSEEMIAALHAEIDAVSRDECVRAVVIAANGPALQRRPRPEGDDRAAQRRGWRPRLFPAHHDAPAAR